MRFCAFLFSAALLASLAGDSRAQCQRGAGRATPSPGLTTATGTSITTTVPIVASGESASQMMQRLYAQEMQRAYVLQMQRAYLEQAHERQQSLAKAKEAKRQERIAYWKEYREAEKARREAAKNRRQTDRSLVSN
jgi:hypothetical protein